MGVMEQLVEAINKNTEALKERNALMVEQNKMFADTAVNLADLNKAQVKPCSCESSSPIDDPVAAELAGVTTTAPMEEEKKKRTRKPKEAPPVEQVIEESPTVDEFESDEPDAFETEEEFQPTVEDVKTLTAQVLAQDRFKNPVMSVGQLKSDMRTFCEKVLRSSVKASEMSAEQLKKFHVYLTALDTNISAGKYGEIK